MNEVDSILLNLSMLSRYELKRKYKLYLQGDKVNGIPWSLVQMMKLKGFITQEDMDYIVL